jgi:acetate kinase
MSETIVVFNAGSTSLKFGAYAITGPGALTRIRRGEIEEMQTDPRFTAQDEAGQVVAEHQWGKGPDQNKAIDHRTAFQYVIDWLEQNIQGMKVVGAGHRMVLGGERFAAPVKIEGDVLEYLESLVVMEPSHQPYNVAGARALAAAFPGLPQVACFDTSFHRTMPAVAQTYALPPAIFDAGGRHWGFHGISYDYISRQVPRHAPDARRVIVAHLGGGASLCAMLDGKSLDTSMGFGGISGLPMSTRSGDVPADLLFYLLRTKQYDDAALEDLLYKHSGLLGLSGMTGDMHTLQESKDPRAAAAIDNFVYCLVKYVGAYTAVLGGLDTLVFTAGIGEHSAPVRDKVCQSLAWMGITLDDTANQKNALRISTADSKVTVLVIPTNEELMIAQHTLALLRP